MSKINNVGLNLGQKIANPFKTSRNITTPNPFKYSNFEGNSLPFADVFEGFEPQKTNKLKMITSSVAGSMTKIKSLIPESIINFANRVSEGLSNAWTYAKSKVLFTLPGEEACKKAMNTDIVDIGKGIGEILNKDALEVGKEVSQKLGVSGTMSAIGSLGNGIQGKWNALVNSMSISKSPKPTKETPVSELRDMLQVELDKLEAEREVA